MDRAPILGLFVVLGLAACSSPEAVSDNSVCPPPKVYSCAAERELAVETQNAPMARTFLQDYTRERHVLAACRNEAPPICTP